jgi:integrase
MPGERPIYQVGDYWLAKRRDGKSPEVWQIARYSPQSRSVVYRSTKRRSLDDAKAVLHAFDAAERSKRPQATEHAELLPHLTNYLREQGPDILRLDTVKSSFRAIIGFLQQDEAGIGVTVANVNKVLLTRFRRWRMAPHSWEVEWGGKVYRHKSQGVSGEAVQRNLEDLRAALNHAEAAGRIVAPKIPSVDRKLRSTPSDLVLTPQELGALVGYARQDIGAWRELCLMLATAVRPGAALAFDPVEQWHGDIIDLHPAGKPVTDKRNAVVPVIEPLRPILQGWLEKPHLQVKMRRRWWATAKRALGLPAGVEGYTIRHTVATWLDQQGVPGAELSAIAGHLPSHRGLSRTTSRHYLHFDPRNCPKATRALTKLFKMVQREADKWAADHQRTTPVRGKPIMIAKAGAEC